MIDDLLLLVIPEMMLGVDMLQKIFALLYRAYREHYLVVFEKVVLHLTLGIYPQYVAVYGHEAEVFESLDVGGYLPHSSF